MEDNKVVFTNSVEDSMSLSLRLEHKCYVHPFKKKDDYYRIQIDPSTSNELNQKLITITQIMDANKVNAQSICFYGDENKPKEIIRLSLEKLHLI